MRKRIPFNHDWRFAKTDACPDTFPADWEAVTLPHTWNAKDGQDGGNDYWRGTASYCKSFAKPELAEGERAFLEINGAAMTADVMLNGKSLAHHEGGYSTFRTDITDALAEENLLCIKADNSDNDHVYPQKADFTFYGGLYRDINLIIVPAVHFELEKDGTPGIRVTPNVDLAAHSAAVTVETWQVGGGSVTFTVAGQSRTVTPVEGHAAAEFMIEDVHLWDGTKDPFLYTADAVLDSGDAVSVRFGCRRMEFDPQKGFLLNGRPYPLRGVSRHQDREGMGNALTLAEHKEDLALIREIGANTIRLAHYQHGQEFYDLCDEAGLVCWAEIPYITMHMPNGRQNTLDQMRELVTQCYNHPCIACWGLSNEITAASAVNEDLLENHRLLNELCHKMDATRPTTMANVFMLETDSPILEIPDINSYNLYFGWYLGDLEQNEEFFDEYHAKYPNRVIGFSEYGADANPQYQSSAPEKGDYTESYQCLYHEHIAAMIAKRPWLWATHVWNMFDFGADGRDEGGKNGQNQKGLVTFDRKTRKDPFYLYKAYWSEEPFVHICGGRYANRAEDVTEVKVYSNQPQVELLVDGKSFAAQTGDKVFRFQVPITGEHTLLAKAGDCTSAILIRRADTPDPAYQYKQRNPVVNWFDQGELDESCYSVADKLADIRQHPEAGKVIDAMMAQGASSHGDVADAVKDNPALQRMMGRMTLLSLLKQSGAEEENIRQINRILQQYKKVE
ncbi:MAG: glycoside hydrolase family 2 protein [Blautia sp.]|nr:glycoside hydrolase family 2 protein [Blautia sp.]